MIYRARYLITSLTNYKLCERYNFKYKKLQEQNYSTAPKINIPKLSL